MEDVDLLDRPGVPIAVMAVQYPVEGKIGALRNVNAARPETLCLFGLGSNEAAARNRVLADHAAAVEMVAFVPAIIGLFETGARLDHGEEQRAKTDRPIRPRNIGCAVQGFACLHLLSPRLAASHGTAVRSAMGFLPHLGQSGARPIPRRRNAVKCSQSTEAARAISVSNLPQRRTPSAKSMLRAERPRSAATVCAGARLFSSSAGG